MRGFRDRDFVESFDGLIFCVIGNVHPRDGVIGYLKYVANMESSIRVKWSRDGVMYGRILPFYSATGVKSVLDFLKRNYPEYVKFDEYRGIEFIRVPRNKISIHYKPEERLREIEKEPKDSLESLALELASRISEESGVPLTFFGVTGSILLKIHNLQYSDIDLIIYGVENSYRVREALKKLYKDEKSGFSLPSGKLLDSWAEEISRIHPLTVDEAKILYSKHKWNRALYKNRQFSIHPVKLENEVNEEWEQKRFRYIGLATIRARIVDAKDSIFMPAVYVVDNVKVVEGIDDAKKINYVVSYEGLYIDIASENEEIIAMGKVEEVEDIKKNEKFYQLTIGTFEARGKDFIKPIAWLKNI
ncbi:hypothetical protein QPL79_04555 [Ignisphaera sp. 4213-co]|uniref:Polymerase nucleotidyl transferase domain-containing protein n=1 Tax=Ignisphaera cupida TaxID=3050454 RepID=A0ABD4Z7E1_9CREN|nr:hypothetical protein [Ignisphaera sp. 4213-co]MDK6028624.1 hypothetical protein [Ignisphaera sp. 4213-co]